MLHAMKSATKDNVCKSMETAMDMLAGKHLLRLVHLVLVDLPTVADAVVFVGETNLVEERIS